MATNLDLSFSNNRVFPWLCLKESKYLKRKSLPSPLPFLVILYSPKTRHTAFKDRGCGMRRWSSHQILLLGCVNSGRWLHLSVLSFLSCKNEDNNRTCLTDFLGLNYTLKCLSHNQSSITLSITIVTDSIVAIIITKFSFFLSFQQHFSRAASSSNKNLFPSAFRLDLSLFLAGYFLPPLKVFSSPQSLEVRMPQAGF